MKKERTQALVTIIVAGLLILNTVLSALGLNPIPISEDMVYLAVSSMGTLVATTVAWWKNQNWTEAAASGQTITDAIKSGDATKIIEAAEAIKDNAEKLAKKDA